MAIAFDAAVDGGNTTGTSRTYSHTIGAVATPILVVCFLGDNVIGGFDDITSVTYNAVAMTFVGKFIGPNIANSRFLYVYIMQNAPTGAHNVVISCTNSHFLCAVSVSYSGGATASQPDNSQVFSNPTTASSNTTSLQTLEDNCWVITCDGGSNLAAGAGSTLRVQGAAFLEPAIFDSNAVKNPAGFYSMNTTSGGSNSVHIMLSIAPSGTTNFSVQPSDQLIFRENVNGTWPASTAAPTSIYISDVLTLSDSIIYNPYLSDFLALSDNVFISLNLFGIPQYDQLVLSDFVDLSSTGSPAAFTDQITFSDSVGLTLSSSSTTQDFLGSLIDISLGDTLSLSDALGSAAAAFILSENVFASDQFIFFDALQLTEVPVRILLSDTLFIYDGDGPFGYGGSGGAGGTSGAVLSTGTSDYIRRYLNDVNAVIFQ